MSRLRRSALALNTYIAVGRGLFKSNEPREGVPFASVRSAVTKETRDLVVSLTAIQPATSDWTINLRRWTMKPPILRVELATAKISAIF